MYDIEYVAGKPRDIPDSITVSVNISVGIIQGKDDVVACRWSLSVEVSGEVLDLQRLQCTLEVAGGCQGGAGSGQQNGADNSSLHICDWGLIGLKEIC